MYGMEQPTPHLAFIQEQLQTVLLNSLILPLHQVLPIQQQLQLVELTLGQIMVKPIQQAVFTPARQ